MDQAQAQAQATRNPQVPDRPQVFDPELAAETETASTDLLESSIVASYKYKPPGASSSSSFSFSSSSNSLPPPRPVEWVCNPSDGSVLLDHKGKPVSVDKLLTTKPLRHDLSSRPGPGGKKLTYISGEGVSRTLNDIFGFDGWNIDITQLQREECLKENGRYTVVYTAMVKLTHRKTGAYKVDAGVGDSTDKSFATAVGHAMKSSITDAMKRAARHFGDKLGNSLYQGNFSINKAPTSLKDALDRTDIDRANTKFGFPKDQVKAHPPSPPFPQASKPSAHVVAQQSMAPPQQQYSSNHGRAPSSAPKSTNNTNHHGPGPPVSRPSAEAVQGPSYNNHQYQAIATHLQNSRMDPVNSKNQTQKHSHHPTNQNNKGNSYTNKQHQQTAANPSHSANHNHSNPGLNNTATAVTKASTVAATAGPYSMPPPPTAADALSSLFKGNENSQNLIPHRPNTSNGRRDSDSSRRISIGDGLPIQQASLVTPAAAATNGKRPPFTNIQNMDPTMHKKQHVNPYYTSNR